MLDAVAPLRKAFDVDTDVPSEIAALLASTVVAACSSLSDWLNGVRAPKGLRKAEGELGAVAGVYKNAAFAFRSLVDADVAQRVARVAGCETMLNHADDLVEVFVATLEKKLGDRRP